MGFLGCTPDWLPVTGFHLEGLRLGLGWPWLSRAFRRRFRYLALLSFSVWIWTFRFCGGFVYPVALSFRVWVWTFRFFGGFVHPVVLSFRVWVWTFRFRGGFFYPCLRRWVGRYPKSPLSGGFVLFLPIVGVGVKFSLRSKLKKKKIWVLCAKCPNFLFFLKMGP